MLTIEEKVSFLKEYLIIKNDNYADMIKEEIYFSLFEKNDYYDFNFIVKLNSQKEIEDKVELLVSKIILHEHEDVLTNIIENYI